MRFKTMRKEMLFPLLPCVFLMGWGMYLQAHAQDPLGKSPISTKDVTFSRTTGADLKAGYDTRVTVALVIHGKPPERANHRYAGGNIVCRNTRIVQVRSGMEYPVTGQTPRILVSTGKTSSVSFFLNRARLSAGDYFLRSTVACQYSYNTPHGGKFYDSPGTPVDIPLSLVASLDNGG